MKTRKKIIAKLGLGLLLFSALVFVVLPFRSWAAEDFDYDGILDTNEGLCLPLGAQNCAITDLTVPDLFVLLQRDPQSSLLPDNPFDFINTETVIFNIQLHEMGWEDAPDQTITGTQYAVKLIEDPSTSDGDLGTSQIGTPAQRISGRVFPQRILDDVEKACGLQPNCEAVNSAGQIVATNIPDIFDFYAKNVVTHETFHMLGRVVPSDRKFDYHYAQLGYIMDHHMFYKESKKNKTVTWYITDTWSEADQPRFK